MASSPVTQSSGSLIVESPGVPAVAGVVAPMTSSVEGVFDSLMRGPYPVGRCQTQPSTSVQAAAADERRGSAAFGMTRSEGRRVRRGVRTGRWADVAQARAPVLGPRDIAASG